MAEIWNWLSNLFLSAFRVQADEGYRPVPTNDDDLEEELNHEQEDEGLRFQTGGHPIFRWYPRLRKTAPIFGGTFQELTRESRNRTRLILVYLHSPEHVNTEEFVYGALASDQFINCVNENNYLFYVASIQTREGMQLSSSLRVTTFPFLGIVMTSSTQSRRITSLGKIEGRPRNLQRLVRQLQEYADRAQPQLVADQQEQQRRHTERSERENQDLEYQRSLEIDRQRLQAAENERKKREEEEQEKKREEEKQEKRKQQSVKNVDVRRELRKRFKNEPSTESAIMVRFRFPNGKTLERKFDPNDKVAVLYEFIHCVEEPWKPQDDSLLEDYSLVVNFPKRQLDPEAVIKDANLKNEIVFVSEIFE